MVTAGEQCIRNDYEKEMVDGVRNVWREHYSNLLNMAFGRDKNTLNPKGPVQDTPPLTESC